MIETGLRIPVALHALITEWATEEGRSLNAHIVYLIRQAAATAGKKESE